MNSSPKKPASPEIVREDPLGDALGDDEKTPIVDWSRLGSSDGAANPIAKDAKDKDPLIGQTPLGQYKILKKLGQGGFGAVYLADQIGVARKAVIKVLRPELVDSPVFVKRFQREATVLAALDHHHLVRLYNSGQLESGELFLAMEYGGEITLEDLIQKEGRLAPERALLIAEQLCGALEDAHRRGVVHRDIKPANVLLSKKGEKDWAKLVDVGIAKLLDHSDVDGADGSILTGGGMVIGTPTYFSPEQAHAQTLDGRSDLYSLGLLVYEAMTGQLAITGKSAVDFLRAHTADAPRTLKAAGLDAPPSLEKLIAKALAKNRDDRFADAGTFAAALAAEREKVEKNPPLAFTAPVSKEPYISPDGQQLSVEVARPKAASSDFVPLKRMKAKSPMAKALPFVIGALVLAGVAFALLR